MAEEKYADNAPTIDPPRPPSKRKQGRTKWCKGKVGVPHQPVLEIDHRRDFTHHAREGAVTCRKTESWRRLPGEPKPTWETVVVWDCSHIQVCTVCGKILDAFPPCPDKPEGIDYWGYARRRMNSE